MLLSRDFYRRKIGEYLSDYIDDRKERRLNQLFSKNYPIFKINKTLLKEESFQIKQNKSNITDNFQIIKK